jgi:hypothetical protein
MRESDKCKGRAGTLFSTLVRMSILLNRASAASVREASDTLPERGKLLNHMLAGKPTGCVAGATVFVNLGSNLCEDRVHLRHTSGDATGAASTKPMSAPSTARALTR